MAEIINLRRARKQKERAEADKTAEQNRISFGRTKAERSLTNAERDKAARHIDGHRLTRAFSSEAEAGSREENAIKQRARELQRFGETRKSSRDDKDPEPA